jgi:CheY-like chemotaxis protein
MQIVIVSDYPEQVASLQSWAFEAGIASVECFTHPAAALDWCLDHEPDLVLVDYAMRACDGLEFLRRFRAMPHLNAVSIVLMHTKPAAFARCRASRDGKHQLARSRAKPASHRARPVALDQPAVIPGTPLV